MSRTLRVVLFVSVALNLFFIGSATIHFIGWRWHRPPSGPAAILDRLAHNLDDQDIGALRGTYAAHRTKLDELFADVQAGRYHVRVVLAAEPFDQGAFHTALAEAHARRDAYSREVEATIEQVAGKLSPEGRRELFTASRNPPPPPPGGPPPH